MTKDQNPITTALAWCLAWGDCREPRFELAGLQKMRHALNNGDQVPEEVRSLVDQVQQLQNIDLNEFPNTFQELQNKYADLWSQQTKIGLVYGGATKIKQYVFEAAKLSDIRGASALLDRINLIDLPAFFGHYDGGVPKSITVENWLKENFPSLSDALIPELLIYYKGGNVLAFCPAAFVDDLANEIERRYTEETLTANSCGVGKSFNLLEVRFGLLDNADNFWLDKYLQNKPKKAQPHQDDPKIKLIESYFGNYFSDQGSLKSDPDLRKQFAERKNFNELVTSLAIAFNQRRSGNLTGDRPSRAYPPIFETHPYLVRDESDRRPSVFKAERLPDQPNMSETLARKRLIGQFAKRQIDSVPQWYLDGGFDWIPREKQLDSWVNKFEKFLQHPDTNLENIHYPIQKNPHEALSLREIGQVGKGFVGYIYADGNNMGGYIQNKIQTPEQYRQFSDDIFEATEQSAYYALAKHLQPAYVQRESESGKQTTVLIHPFEIIAIGGDDVLIIVPADKALAIAQTIGERFEKILKDKGRYAIPNAKKPKTNSFQRYQNGDIESSESILSTSLGVLITAENTPIYYAENLVSQLLKSAKEKAKHLKAKYGYHGGTIDFLSMKSVTMLSSKVKDFRKEGLTKGNLRFYATPYTLHEIGGLIEVVKTLKSAKFPRSQLYQLRSLLENGKQTAIINYRYFRVRLKDGQSELRLNFEDAWCKPKTNEGNLAPWMSIESDDKNNQTIYETIWRDLVDIYDFVEVEKVLESKALEEVNS